MSPHTRPLLLWQITQQLEGICLQVIGTVLQQHVLGKSNQFFLGATFLNCSALGDELLTVNTQLFQMFDLLRIFRILWGDPVAGSQPDLPAGVATDVATSSACVWSLPAGRVWLLHRCVSRLSQGWEIQCCVQMLKCLFAVWFKRKEMFQFTFPTRC